MPHRRRTKTNSTVVIQKSQMCFPYWEKTCFIFTSLYVTCNHCSMQRIYLLPMYLSCGLILDYHPNCLFDLQILFQQNKGCREFYDIFQNSKQYTWSLSENLLMSLVETENKSLFLHDIYKSTLNCILHHVVISMQLFFSMLFLQTNI